MTTFVQEGEEKEIVQEYLQTHSLENTLNSVINRVVTERPSDPFIVLSSLLRQHGNTNAGIVQVDASQILDGNGVPTLQVSISTHKGTFTGSVPGSVPGIYDVTKEVEADVEADVEAGAENQDQDEEEPEKKIPLYGGKSLHQCASDFSVLVSSSLENVDPTDQGAVDTLLESMLPQIGQNGVLALSIAICKAGAREQEVSLYEHIATTASVPVENACIPMPIFTLVNGGTHSSTDLYLTDISIIPVTADSMTDAILMGFEVSRALKELCKGSMEVGASGGLVLQGTSVEQALTLVNDAILEAQKVFGSDNVCKVVLHVGADDFVVHPPESEEVVEELQFTYNLDLWTNTAKPALKNRWVNGFFL